MLVFPDSVCFCNTLFDHQWLKCTTAAFRTKSIHVSFRGVFISLQWVFFAPENVKKLRWKRERFYINLIKSSCKTCFPQVLRSKKYLGQTLIYEALRDNQEFFVLLIHFLSVIQIVFLPCSWLQNWRENSFEGDTFPEMFSHLWKKEKIRRKD